MDFDVLIIGAGAAGLSCALILGSAVNKSYAQGKRTGIIMHQKTSHLQTAVFNNVLGLPAGTPGMKILKEGAARLKDSYPHVAQITGEKVKEIKFTDQGFIILTNKNSYTCAQAVLAVGYSDLITIKGIEEYIIPHKKAPSVKNRIQLINEDHLVRPGLYVAGSLAGHRSQYAIACGSGAVVATEILTEWNNGEHATVHDKL